MIPISGNIIRSDGRIVNLVELLRGGTPVSDTRYDFFHYAPRSGNLLRPDGSVVNLVDLLGGGTPVSSTVYDLSTYAQSSALILGPDGKAYDLAALLQSYNPSGSPPQPVETYLARYSLTGEPNAPVPATLSDLSGNGNDLTLNGFTAYDANGRLTTTGAESFFLPALNIGTQSSYRLRIAFSNLTNSARNLRVFNSADDLFMLFVSQAQDSALVSQGDESAYYGYKFEWYNGENKIQYHIADVLTEPSNTLTDCVMELTVNGSNVHVTVNSHGYAGASARETSRDRNLTVPSAASLLSGFYLFNRADGTRGLAATVTEIAVIAG